MIISDTAGRAWRVGQTDHAIGAAGVLVRRSYAGEQDGYGNQLEVTEMALADELAAAADLAKGKLGGRPVAVIRGLADLVVDSAAGAETLVRPPAQDLFGFGSAESVLAAALAGVGPARCLRRPGGTGRCGAARGRHPYGRRRGGRRRPAAPACCPPTFRKRPRGSTSG